MNNPRQIIEIRRRKLAALLVDSRLSTRRTVEESAAALNLSPEAYQALESGSESPSLPQLELLSLFWDIPIHQFWGKPSRQPSPLPHQISDYDRALALRNRLIGATLRLARTSAGLTLAQLAEKVGLDEETLNLYELGQKPVPFPELETLADALGLSMDELVDRKGPIGEQIRNRAAMQQFLDLPAELRAFIANPVNRPYLELAMRLSAMDTQKLRSIAEGILEITF